MAEFFVIFISMLILAAVFYGLWKKDQQYSKYANFRVPEPEVEKYPLPTKVDTPLDMAVNEIYPQFDGMAHYFERMSEDTFRSYCHSQISGGIGMRIRNHFNFWLMHNKEMEPSLLYEYLKNHYYAIHPDGMSDMIIKAVYRKYHREHPEARTELKRFEKFKHSAEYRPVIPFDIRYPDEK